MKDQAEGMDNVALTPQEVMASSDKINILIVF